METKMDDVKGVNKLTKAKKTRRLNVKISETFYQILKNYISETKRYGDISSMVRTCVENEIMEEMGKPWYNKQLLGKKDERILIEVDNNKISSFEKQLAEMKRLDSETSNPLSDIENSMISSNSENVSMYSHEHTSLKESFKPEYLQYKGNKFFISKIGGGFACAICEKHFDNKRGMNKHSCPKLS